ncbi:uncharacterized protein LOC105217985 [Zeugodacus cucurbitae]|uniref:uncharacterized protein LOC105217985 n=1 Tax=Zeugodacus cucurbitae TaxID=28588 RepID=UPI0023D94187|nr:uncharacterized protein LOC105217985 [Zeugodacus cucurbitae]
MGKNKNKGKKGVPELAKKPLTNNTGKTDTDICSRFKNKLSFKDDVEKTPGPYVRKPHLHRPFYRNFKQPDFGHFEVEEELEYYYPTNEMKMAQENRFDSIFLAQNDNIIKDYINTKELTPNNVRKIFQMLIEIEDLHTMQPYCQIYLKNVTVTKSENYIKFNINMPSYIKIDKVLNPLMDEVVFVPLLGRENNQLSYPVDLLLNHPHESLGRDNKLFREVGLLDKLERKIAYVESSNPHFNSTKEYDIIFRSRRMSVRYQRRALELLDEVRRDYMFPNINPHKEEETREVKLEIINIQICENPEQLQAVQQIFGGANPYAPYIVVGPPGTGKTITIVEAILQLYINRPQCRILITASTNSACDKIALKLGEQFENNPLLRKLSSQRSNPPTDMLRVFSESFCKKDIKNVSRTILEHSNYCERECKSPSVEVLQKYNIIIVTLMTMGRLRTGTTGDWPFTHVFIDEAGATMETEALIAITSVDTKNCRVILSGDTKQLGPVIMSPIAAELGLKSSLMERLLQRNCYAVNTDGTYDYTLQTRLRRNFRSHPAIVNIYNHLYYGNELLAKVNLDNLMSCKNIEILKNKKSPVFFLAIGGELEKSSRSSLDALIWIIKMLKTNIDDIGVISSYKLQCRHIMQKLKQENIRGVEVGTVELFQGGGKHIIIAFGFTGDPKRLNLVLSRAQSLLILIGKPQTLQQSDDFVYIINECKNMDNYYIFKQPDFGRFKPIKDLEDYYPTNEMKIAQENRFDSKFLAQNDNTIKDYINTKELTSNNICKIFKMLIEIEDLHTMLPYCQIYLQNVKVTECGKHFKFYINVPPHINIDEILNPLMDEVVIVPLLSREVSLSYPVDILLRHPHESPKCVDKFFRNVGLLHKLKGKTAFVEFANGNTNIDTTKIYDIIFRPCRMSVRYQHRALELLDEMRREYVFPNINPHKAEQPRDVKLELLNRQICENPEQLQAVQQIVGGANPYAPYIVVGPPGTGKTTTIAEAILQLYINRPQCRILVTASTNSACDTIALKLGEQFENNPLLRKLSSQRSGVDFMGRPNPRTDMLRVFSKSYGNKDMKNVSLIILEHSNYPTLKYKSPSLEYLKEYNIIIVTLVTIGRLRTGTMGDLPFTHVFIDEAGATMETEALIAITSVDTKNCRVILSGDTKQLGPVIMSPIAAELGLKSSLMERLLQRNCYAVSTDGTYDYTLQTRLRRNFRSHPAIVNIYNHLYYDNELLAKVNLDNLMSCENIEILKNKNFPVIFLPVYGKVGKSSKSRSSFNTLEIDALIGTIKQLRAKPGDIGVISPYKLQCTLIKLKLKEKNIQGVEVGTVELFQGREKHIIIASFVKSFGNLGFTADPKRLNVVLSRAQSLLILIGNPQTLQQSNDFVYIINKCKNMDNYTNNVQRKCKRTKKNELFAIAD